MKTDLPALHRLWRLMALDLVLPRVLVFSC